MFENINLIAVLVTAILSVAVGSIWYSPLLFGPLWMRGAGLTSDIDEMSTKKMIHTVILAVFVQGIFFSLVAQFIALSHNNTISLTQIGVLLAGLLVVSMMGSVIWEKRPVSYFLINAGYTVLILFGGVGIITFWPW